MTAASIALNRFGLGARAGETAPSQPRAWLLEQIEAYQPRPATLAGTKSSIEAIAVIERYRDARQQFKAQAQKTDQATAALATAGMTDAAAPPAGGARKRGARRMAIAAAAAAGEPPEMVDVRATMLDALQARFATAAASATPFMERIVQFWSNHFAVSADNPRTVPLVGASEFEAIRPHVLGRFGDLLAAAETHPAMLLYLDQAQSIGPTSPAGRFIAARGRRKAGINENLAREIMELHTLGVRSVYTQDDVNEFARALTGWTVPALGQGPLARFADTAAPSAFVAALHEPGERTVIGRRYAAGEADQPAAILADFATHSATARFVATKLARHFAGDEPPPALVARLEADFLRTGGDLPSLYRVLIDSPEAWVEQPVKFRTPWEWTVASARAVGIGGVPGRMLFRTLQDLGQTVWKPGSPAGFDDIAASWAAPNALMRRVEVAARLAGQAHGDPRQLAETLFPGALSPATATAIARAESPQQGTALLLAAPEMMRR